MKKSLVDKAVNCFKGGYSCSIAIFSTYGPEFGIDEKTAIKTASAFGGGMARMGETCGAVTGAFMVLGVANSAKPGESREDYKERLYSYVRKFADEFKSQNKSIKCSEILGCDISTPEGHKVFKEKNLINTVCVQCVQDAAVILEKLLS
jgi:C_GCAxxG_C_C family probable redox protein